MTMNRTTRAMEGIFLLTPAHILAELYEKLPHSVVATVRLARAKQAHRIIVWTRRLGSKA